MGCVPGLPKCSPGLELANAFSVRRCSRVSSRKIHLVRIPPMLKHVLSVFLSCFLVGHLSAQVPQNAPAPEKGDDYNGIFKTVKWRSIGPFRGGRSNPGCGVVGGPKTSFIGTTGGGLWKKNDMGISCRKVSHRYFINTAVAAMAVSRCAP